MKIFNYLRNLTLATAAVCCIASCQSEEEVEDYILDGVCFGGKNPVTENHGQQNYTSNYYFFEENGYGVGFEESFYQGVYDTTYEFSWYWYDNSYRLMVFNYGGRWGDDMSYVDIWNAKKGRIKGWFYESYNDYMDYNKNNGNSNPRRGTSVEWKRIDDYDRAYADKLLTEWREVKRGNKKAESYVPLISGSGKR